MSRHSSNQTTPATAHFSALSSSTSCLEQEPDAKDLVRKYKRGYFVDWRMCDGHKRGIIDRVDYYLDTNTRDEPKMLTIDLYRLGVRVGTAVVTLPVRLALRVVREPARRLRYLVRR